jgi:hypothetical protein
MCGASGNSITTYGTPADLFDLDARISALFPEINQLVGIEPRQDNIVKWLMEDHIQQLRVISLFGFGGLGKTTLAMTVYQSLSATNACFQYQAFATVSQKFDAKVLMRGILQQIIRPGYHPSHSRDGEAPIEDPLKGIEEWDVGQLANMLRQKLENKKYLIVLDDIWSISAWEGIRFFSLTQTLVAGYWLLHESKL